MSKTFSEARPSTSPHASSAASHILHVCRTLCAVPSLKDEGGDSSIAVLSFPSVFLRTIAFTT